MPAWRAVCGALIAAAACSAAGRGGGEFDGERALAYVQQQLAFGPRVPNTEAHRRAGDWLEQELAARADTLVVQAWTHRTDRGDTLALRNLRITSYNVCYTKLLRFASAVCACIACG